MGIGNWRNQLPPEKKNLTTSVDLLDLRSMELGRGGVVSFTELGKDFSARAFPGGRFEAIAFKGWLFCGKIMELIHMKVNGDSDWWA